MKIALFYRVWFDSGEELLKAGKKLGVELVPINYQDLILRQKENTFEIFWEDQPLSNFDLFYFRAVGSATEWSNLLVLYALAEKIPFVDEYLGVWGPGRRLKSIAGVILGQNQIAYPQTSFASDRDQLSKEAKRFAYPFVLKISKGGRHGLGTLLVKDMQTYTRLCKGRIERSSFLLQEYIPNDGDYRLFLTGYKVLGAFKRQKKEQKLILNRSSGPSESLKRVPSEVVKLAEKAARVLKVEIAAIDMVIDQRTNKPTVIEVNEAPQWRVFTQRTGIDVAGEIVRYLIRKASKK
ncbi:MAG: ATP-grasp domain-containing protein [Candidatus Pacebacteria bacterium]|nr:ATP-grasp domain-containing protein [Candidatus Paceibacterota bacterium]